MDVIYESMKIVAAFFSAFFILAIVLFIAMIVREYFRKDSYAKTSVLQKQEIDDI